jgi:hypothetical protein
MRTLEHFWTANTQKLRPAVFCSVCEQLVRRIRRVKTICKYQFDNQSEAAESDGVGDNI